MAKTKKTEKIKTKEEKPKKEKIEKTDAKVEAVQIKRPEIIKKDSEKKDVADVSEEEFFDDDFSGSFPDTFNYPFMRRGPSIRIQPVAQQLELDLSDIQLPAARTEENNVDQYKPANLDKSYALNQKYELSGGASYESITPKTVGPPASPTLTPGFTNQPSMAFGNQGGTTPVYPGGEGQRQQYDSGLERQARDDKRRRDTM